MKNQHPSTHQLTKMGHNIGDNRSPNRIQTTIGGFVFFYKMGQFLAGGNNVAEEVPLCMVAYHFHETGKIQNNRRIKMGNNEITININDNYFHRTKAAADLIGITPEKLTEIAIGTFLYTVQDYLKNINEHVFPQIMFD